MICAARPASMPTRNDQRALPQGQGKHVPQFLPPESTIDVRGRKGAPTRPAWRGPMGSSSFSPPTTLNARSRGCRTRRCGIAVPQCKAREQVPVLVARLPNARHTLAVVGFAKTRQSGFEHLELAGKLLREALKPGVHGCTARWMVSRPRWPARCASARERGPGQAPHPCRTARRSAPPPCDLRAIEVHEASTREFSRSQAIAAGNHLARWLSVLPPNELDCVAYRVFCSNWRAAKAGRSGSTTSARSRALEGRCIPRRGAREPAPGRRHRAAASPSRTALAAFPRLGLVGKGICFDTAASTSSRRKACT